MEVKFKPKKYVATTYEKKPNEIPLLHLKMAIGQEKICAPSAFLIAFHELCRVLESTNRKKLGAVLVAMNNFYGTADVAAKKRLEWKQEAFVHALPKLLD